jgi:hypothetical protein
MKIHAVGDDLLHADGDGQKDGANSHFPQFCERVYKLKTDHLRRCDAK